MFFKNIFVNPRYPAKLEKLFTLAYNLWSLWDADALGLFYRVDAPLFRSLNKNPIKLLHNITDKRMEELARDEAFLYDLEKVWKKFELYTKHHKLFSDTYKDSTIAYFSMEYGLHKSIPNYAGGLGILSGDHLKGASDIGIPIIGVGLFYRYGYFNQRINVNGLQEENYVENDVYYMPIRELKDERGESVFVTVDILGKPVKVKGWYINVGMIKLILLDTNVEDNPTEFRAITNYLYDADRDKRIQQEIILGFGGPRMLDRIGIKPTIYHLNEGHSAFLILERLKSYIGEGYTFSEACKIVKASSVFTTHTPVQAGNENYPVEKVKEYLEKDIEALGIKFDNFAQYGFYGDEKTFWLPALAIRFASRVNGVSKLHAEVSRKMWKDLFLNRLFEEIPIIGITNGAHYSWLSTEMQQLFSRYLGPDFIYSNNNEGILKRILEIPDEEIWEAHMQRKREMIAFLRDYMKKNYTEKGFSLVKIRKVQDILNPRTLTIGYARRFATYKRATLIIKDKERLKRLISNPDKPVQIIFSGKAHPADLAGKNMIKEIIDYAREYGLEDRIIFVENYDRSIAEHIVQGVDVWLNNPIKPLEASGTSGMKAGMNGVLNLSVLDGWWPECYNCKNGWAITAGEIYENQELKDLAEANQIYDTIEEDILNLYYRRDEHDIPREWVRMMKESIYTVFKGFNIGRMLEDYSHEAYIPAIETTRKLTEGNGKLLKELEKEYQSIRSVWDKIHIKDVFTDIDSKEALFSGDTINIDCYVYLDDAGKGLFDLELCYYVEKKKELKVEKMHFAERYDDKTAKFNIKLKLESSGIQKLTIRLVPANREIRLLYPELIKLKDSQP